MASLQDFYNDVESKNNVKEYLVEFLTNEAVRAVFADEDVKGITRAKEIIEAAFENLDTIFAKKVERNTENEAR